MDTVDVGGLRIAYRKEGAGLPVVLLHGFVGDGRATWYHQIEGLSDAFTVIAWDAPGAGASSDPPESFRLEDFADCLAEFLEAVGVSPVHMVGLSFGGALAIEFVSRRPEKLESLVLAGAYAGWSGSLPSDAVEQRLAFCRRVADLPPDDFASEMVPSMFSDSVLPERRKEFEAAVSAFHPAGFRAMALASAEADLRHVLGGIRLPTLILHGEKDERAPLTVAQELHEGIRDSTLVVLDGVGHVSPVEAPDRFTQEVRGFLEQTNA